jgi:hypothetical protein
MQADLAALGGFPAVVAHLRHSCLHGAAAALGGLEGLCIGVVGAGEGDERSTPAPARRAALAAGAVEAALAALAAYPQDVDVQHAGSRALSELVGESSSGPDADGVARATAGGAFAALLAAVALSVRGAEPELACFALRALQYLQPAAEGATAEGEEEEACVAVLAALTAHAAHDPARELACSALHNWLFFSRRALWPQERAGAHAGALARALGVAAKRACDAQAAFVALDTLRLVHLRLAGSEQQPGTMREEVHAAFVAGCVAEGVPASLTAALREHAPASEDVARSTALLLARLCRMDDPPAHKARFENALPPLVAVLAAHPGCELVALDILRVLPRCVAHAPRASRRALEAGVLPPALAALRDHGADEAMQAAGMLALRHLAAAVAAQPDAAQRAHGATMAAACAAAMRALPGSVVVTALALGAVTQMASESGALCAAAVDAGVVPLAVAALTTHHRGHVTVTREACRCLNALASRAPSVRAAERRDGLLGAALVSLRTLADARAPEQAAHACALVASLAAHAVAGEAANENASLLAAAGIMPLLTQVPRALCAFVCPCSALTALLLRHPSQALSAHPECVALQHMGCHALRCMCVRGHPGKDATRGAARAAGAVRAATRAMRAHPANADVQDAAADALSALAAHEKRGQQQEEERAVWGADGARDAARSLVAAWCAHGDHAHVPTAAARALAQLCMEAPRGFAAAATRAGVAAPAARALCLAATQEQQGVLDVMLIALGACIGGSGVGTAEYEDAMRRAHAAGVSDALACVSAPAQAQLSRMARTSLTHLLEWFSPRGEAAAAAATGGAASGSSHAVVAPPHACDGCGTTALPVKLCSSCRGARYCGAACQRAHWREHKAACRAAAAAAAAADSDDDDEE